jgi:VIT1/CCC1 family predicted Fe2+/Mn2+ transporter
LSGRTFALVAVLTVIGVLTYLTVALFVQEGPSVRVFISLGLLALFGFGVVGALTEKHDE